eukprot:COSAG01_NODE_7105_length_3352_cov_3.350753_1_plen_170_part_10
MRSDHGPGTLPVHRTSGTFAAKMARAASAFAADTSWLSLKRVPSTSVATTRTGPAVWLGGICLLLVGRQHCGQEEAGTCRRTPPALQLCNARGPRPAPRPRSWLGQRFSAQTQAKILLFCCSCRHNKPRKRDFFPDQNPGLAQTLDFLEVWHNLQTFWSLVVDPCIASCS